MAERNFEHIVEVSGYNLLSYRQILNRKRSVFYGVLELYRTVLSYVCE